MKEKRIINEEEKNILINSKIKSEWSLGRLFYIMALLLPLLVCMIITKYFAYLYIFIILLILYLFFVFVPKMLLKRYVKQNEIYAYDSKVLSCKTSEFYYYLVEIEDLKGEFLDYRFPVSRKLKKDTEITVIMTNGVNRYSRYLLINKKTKEVLTSKRTRFDLIN